MSIKKSTPKSKPKNPKLLLDANGERYRTSQSRKTYVSRKGKLISNKELKRRELQRANDLGLGDVNIFELVTKQPIVNVGTLTRQLFWVRFSLKIRSILSRIFKWKSHGKKETQD